MSLTVTVKVLCECVLRLYYGCCVNSSLAVPDYTFISVLCSVYEAVLLLCFEKCHYVCSLLFSTAALSAAAEFVTGVELNFIFDGNF